MTIVTGRVTVGTQVINTTASITLPVDLPLSFPPPTGKLFYGASEDSTVVLAGQVGRTLGIDREYFNPGDTANMVAYATAAANRGSLPVVSIKPQGTWGDIAAGRQDTWLRGIISGLAAIGRPVLWSINHEPENDTGTAGKSAADFVAMCEYVTAMHDVPGKTGVWFGPIYMSGKYNPVAAPNPAIRLKIEDWCTPRVGHYYGFDGYNHYDPASGKLWRTVSDTFNWFVNGGVFKNVRVNGLRNVDATKPIVICEYGCRDDLFDSAKAPAWLEEAFNWALAQGIAGMSYFSSAANVNDGGGTWKLTGGRLAKFKELINRASSVIFPAKRR